jgi:hypothetical protein
LPISSYSSWRSVDASLLLQESFFEMYSYP